MRIKRRTRRLLIRSVWSVPVILLVAFLYLLLRPPSSAAPSAIHVSMATDRIERGRYLFTALSDCDGCHSERDYTRPYAPVNPAGRGKGGVMPWNGLPGQVVASNITPDPETGIGSWTDGEKIRAIREGIGKDGRALFPAMPYTYYSAMSDQDVQSLVAYMNTLTPVRNALPKTKLTFPASMWIKGIPAPISRPIPQPDPDGGEIYGEYLATLAACENCHTPPSGNGIDTSLRFAGGRPFRTPFGTVTSANITPDNDTGIGKWNFLRFQKAMRAYADPESANKPAGFSAMPWASYSQLTDGDLEVIFLYLKSRTPRSHKVASN